MSATNVYDEFAFIRDVHDELRRAELNHGPMHSLHEAYAVILEEVDELWELCRLKRSQRSPGLVREELIQIAAMAWRAACNLGIEYPPEPTPPSEQATSAEGDLP